MILNKSFKPLLRLLWNDSLRIFSFGDFLKFIRAPISIICWFRNVSQIILQNSKKKKKCYRDMLRFYISTVEKNSWTTFRPNSILFFHCYFVHEIFTKHSWMKFSRLLAYLCIMHASLYHVCKISKLVWLHASS